LKKNKETPARYTYRKIINAKNFSCLVRICAVDEEMICECIHCKQTFERYINGWDLLQADDSTLFVCSECYELVMHLEKGGVIDSWPIERSEFSPHDGCYRGGKD
jgi:hypothetical protein